MPYDHIEQIRDRSDERIALFLTAHNMLGLVLGALPTMLLTGQLPFLLRALLIVGAGTLGVLATIEVGGLPLYGRISWRLRGLLRTRSEGRRVSPDQLGGATAGAGARAIPISDLVRVVEAPPSPQVAATLQRRTERPLPAPRAEG